MATYLELKAQAEVLLKQAEELRQKEVAAVIAEMKEKMAQYGITAKDLGITTADLGLSSASSKKATKASEGSAPKFKGPNGELWSGMGRQPQWLKDALAEGKKKEDFAV
ncbi:H-NS histone family protein [Burkholderia vietnamiensis]|uniref:H-NS histone family protein n=1 Tax=Burkholderia vietnamiensis TaxID=60552 RepID=UPI001CF2BC27|nr:H-NS histone family protein [Burkholderia vietnamiensis]MCA7984119.1 H-NS histone family protein [Burkholderia vietnamiensis]